MRPSLDEERKLGIGSRPVGSPIRTGPITIVATLRGTNGATATVQTTAIGDKLIGLAAECWVGPASGKCSGILAASHAPRMTSSMQLRLATPSITGHFG